MSPEGRRSTAVAGTFYPADPDQLSCCVAAFIDRADVAPAPDKVAAILVPHAGYDFSGPTAGFCFRRVKGATPRRVVLLGCSHSHTLAGPAVQERGTFGSPVGDFPIDEEFARELAESGRRIAGESGYSADEVHRYEHSLEVQLPFIAASIGTVPIVPVLLGPVCDRWQIAFGEALAAMVAEGDLLVVSTDLSHYLSEERTNQVDMTTLDALLSRDPVALMEGLETRYCAMCGGPAAMSAMAFGLARGAEDWTLHDYRTSARVSGDYDRVVGYAALSMEVGE